MLLKVVQYFNYWNSRFLRNSSFGNEECFSIKVCTLLKKKDFWASILENEILFHKAERFQWCAKSFNSSNIHSYYYYNIFSYISRKLNYLKNGEEREQQNSTGVRGKEKFHPVFQILLKTQSGYKLRKMQTPKLRVYLDAALSANPDKICFRSARTLVHDKITKCWQW